VLTSFVTSIDEVVLGASSRGMALEAQHRNTQSTILRVKTPLTDDFFRCQPTSAYRQNQHRNFTAHRLLRGGIEMVRIAARVFNEKLDQKRGFVKKFG
jgi:nicotinamide riboside kinase